MLSLPNVAIQGLALPCRVLAEQLPTGAPTKESEAQGRVKDTERIMVEVDRAGALTLYLWCPVSGAWRLAGATESKYKITFAAAGMDFFVAPAGAKFYIAVDAGTVAAWTDALEV